jgi:hypothetical protein
MLGPEMQNRKMSTIMVKAPTYRLRFFFDYGSGGCLWSGNEAAFQAFGVGALDADTYDAEGNIQEGAPIKLPAAIKERIAALDKRYAESLDGNDPGGPGLWTAAQAHAFYAEARDLCAIIGRALGDEFEVVYAME